MALSGMQRRPTRLPGIEAKLLSAGNLEALDMPEMTTIFVPTVEPSGPFGAKSVAELPIDGVAPAVANGIANAVGVRLRELPMTPERVLAAIKAQKAVA